MIADFFSPHGGLFFESITAVARLFLDLFEILLGLLGIVG